MRTPVLLAALLVASGILLSACGHSYRFVPAYSEQTGSASLSQEAQSPVATEGSRPDAVEATRPPYAPSVTDAAEGSGYNRNTAQVAESQRAAAARTTLADRTDRPAGRDAALDVKRASRGPSMNAPETVDTEAAEASAQAAPAPRGSSGVPKWFLIVLCIFLPPLAVALVYGISDKFWIDVLLTLCFWIPGVIYALIQVL